MTAAIRTAALAIALALAIPCEAQECRASEAVTSFGDWQFPAVNLDRTNWAQSVPVGAGVASIRLLFEVVGGSDRKWNIVVRDDSFRVLATLGPSDFLATDGTFNKKRWTGRISISWTATGLGPTNIGVDLLPAGATDTEIAIRAAITYPLETSDQKLFSVQDPNGVATWKDLYKDTSTARRRAGDAVGMMISAQWDPVSGVKQSWCCSGALVSKDILLTNWHCGGNSVTGADSYWNSDVCANTLVDFGWDDGKVRRQYSCTEVLSKSQALDFALIRLAPLVGGGAMSGEPVRAQLTTDGAATDIYVIHHAMCKPKLVSANCRIDDASFAGWQDAAKKTEFTHTCDTEPGASGAPVFDAKGRVMGLHHLGFTVDDHCNRLDHVNKAVWVSDVVNFVKTDNPAVAAEIGFAP